MTKRGSRWTLALALLCLVGLAPLGYAQPSGALATAVDLHERGKDVEALAKLKEVVNSDPSSETAWALINSIDMTLWARMMTRSGEHAAVIKTLFNASMPAARAKARDAAAIKGHVATAGDESASWADRSKAMTALAADHGEYAVPHMLEQLGSDDSARRAAYINICRRLGTQAVLPLVQALEIKNPNLQASALTALGLIKDARSTPYVAGFALGAENNVVRDAARQALVGMGITEASPQATGGLFSNLAEAYYRRDTAVVDPFRSTYVAWSQADGKLVAREVPRDIYHLKLAEEVLYDMVNWDANQMHAQVLLGSVLVAQQVAANGAAGDGPEAALNHAGEMAASMGTEIMGYVVRKALTDGRPAVAAGAVRVLGSISDGRNFQAPNALTDALGAPYKSVRFSAALAIAGLRQPGQPGVVSVLTEALGQDAVRSVVVIDDNADTRNQIVADLNARGYFAYGVAGGAIGLARLRDYPIEDLVIMRYNMGDATVAEVMKTIRADARTADTPVAILCDPSDREAAENAYAEKAQAFITTPPTADAYEPGLRALVKDLDDARAEATAIASQAARSLLWMPPTLSAPAVNGLVGTLKGHDSVRTPALRALGRIADPSASNAIMAVFMDGTASETVRGHAAVALASIARASGGQASADLVTALHGAIVGGGGADYLDQLGRACGMLPVDSATRTKLLNALRSKINVDTETDDG
ncbi:MAG: response regulator [Planctomycetes bacterium]|nr:response regulator [Planctomycetota bacterium]